jgi:6-phosphogluconolactonase (cycloisomerase 2 family)
MAQFKRLILVVALLTAASFLSGCGSSNMHAGAGSGGGTGGSGSGSGSGSSGVGTANAVPGFGAGTGASGQTSAAMFLFANPVPGGGPNTAIINSNGTLTLQAGGSANNANPMTMAIDPSGSFLFQTTQGGFNGSMGGLFVFAINRTNGTLGTAIATDLPNQPLVDAIVDNAGKFVYALSPQGGVSAFSNQAGVLTPVAGSPFRTPAVTSLGVMQPATLMQVDQTNHYLYVSSSGGIAAFTINQTTGQLAPVPGSPFATSVTQAWAIVITPSNSFLLLLQANRSNSSGSSSPIYSFSIDLASGALTPAAGSPFSGGGCGSVTSPGTIGVPFPDNMTIASDGRFMYDNCGVYSINETSGAVTQVSGTGPGDWPVIDPTGTFLWAITSDQTACFSCDVGVQAYSVDATTGAFTPVPNGFTSITDTEVGALNSLAITK